MLHALQSGVLRRKETDAIMKRHAAFERLIQKPKLPQSLLQYQADVVRVTRQHQPACRRLRGHDH